MPEVGVKPQDPTKPKQPKGPDVPTFDPREDHSGCDRPERFECGQHYLWWQRNHKDKRPQNSGKKQGNASDGKQSSLSSPGQSTGQAQSFLDVFASSGDASRQVVPLGQAAAVGYSVGACFERTRARDFVSSDSVVLVCGRSPLNAGSLGGIHEARNREGGRIG